MVGFLLIKAYSLIRLENYCMASRLLPVGCLKPIVYDMSMKIVANLLSEL